MRPFDYKEYSRLRSIARKRIERQAAAGIAPLVKIPTVAQVRASGNPSAYMYQVRKYLEEAPTLKAVRETGVQPVKAEFMRAPVVQQLTPEQKRARRNEQKRRSKAKRAVEQEAARQGKSEKETRRRVGYLKALETVAEEWRKAGVDAGHWLGVMSPGTSKKFVEYMEYRFSQGDYTNKYTVDTFIRDFGEFVKHNYTLDTLKQDFEGFLLKQKQLTKNKKSANKYGFTTEEVDNAWRQFVAVTAKRAKGEI